MIFRSMRPGQWAKNLVVFAGLIFGGQLRNVEAVTTSVAAFFSFCALSSAAYLFNDVFDRDVDRHHPLKSDRPIASGAIRTGRALGASAVLTLSALALAFALRPSFAIVAAGYIALMALYSIVLKRYVILDVLAISAGFVLRALGGAVVLGVPFSHWLLLLTILLALFLALGKRRAELVTLGEDAQRHRRALTGYSLKLLDQMIAIVTASTLLAYAFYTISAETVAKFGTDRLVFTLPFPLYGIFRYLYLAHKRDGGGDPSEHLLDDRPLLACVALWGAAVILIIYSRR